jgi:DNA-binding transcriptional LysR family regulator
MSDEWLDLRLLTSVVAVARTGSVTKAASRLGYAQSTVSEQLKRAETITGARLFDRLGRRLALTEAGSALIPYAERIVDLETEARAEVARHVDDHRAASGTMTISAPESLLTYRLPAMLARFRSVAPGVRLVIRPTVVGQFLGSVRQALVSGESDLAFVLDDRVAVAGFEAMTVAVEPISVIAPVGDPLAGRPVAAANLADRTVLLPESPDAACYYRNEFLRQLALARIAPAELVEFASIEAVKQSVIAGIGVGLLPRVAVGQEIEVGRVVELDWSPAITASSQLIRHAGRWRSPAVAAFLEVAAASRVASA